MQFLIFAISASVLVSVFLKVARRQNIQIAQAILVNYAVALVLSVLLLKPNLTGGVANLFFNQGTPIFLALGILLPSIFIVMAKAVDDVGIVKSDMAQRLALFLPIIASFTLFGESLSVSKGVGLLLAFVGLICIIHKKEAYQYQSSSHNSKNTVLLLGGVWFGYGVIDILFKQMSKLGNAFADTLFVSFVLALLVMFGYLLFKKTQWHNKSLLSGGVLGVLNFANILFYVKAHMAFKDDPTLVFAGMNIGVISLGAVVGLWVFKERLSAVNYLGLVIGILSVFCLFYLDRLL